MKATVTETKSRQILTTKNCSFQWYHVKNSSECTYYALPSPYGVTYIDKTGHVSYSSRNFFNEEYTVIKEAGTLTITFKESE
jgi:hypothetical protein